MNLAATFGPSDLGGAFAAGLPTVLGYLGAAVAAAIVGVLVFVGIKKGIRWGANLLGGYRYDRDMGAWMHKDAGGYTDYDDHYGNAGIGDDLRDEFG